MVLKFSSDIVIVGAGTSGCVAATRLVGAGFKVILIDAGPDFGHSDQGNWPNEITNEKFMGEDTSFDWGYTAQLGLKEKRYLRGKVFGGSSAINASGINWGLKSDYDRWSEYGIEGWQFNDLLPYFHKVENLQDLENADAERGTNGQIRVTRQNPDQEYFKDFEKSCKKLDLDYIDASGPESAQGYGYVTRNVSDGIRQNPAQSYLDEIRLNKNFTILDMSEVININWHDNRATGLEITRKGELINIKSSQIILCAGAVGSPILLQRSGIGPRYILDKLGFNANNSKVLNGVGENLQDHFGIRYSFKASPYALKNIQWDKGGSIRIRLKQFQEDTGHNLTFSSALSPFASNGKTTASKFFHSIVWLVQPKSKGNIFINSKDNSLNPTINFNFGSSHDEDIKSILYGLEWSREFVQSSPINKWISNMHIPSDHCNAAELMNWIQNNLSFYYHMVGTCRMGAQNDPQSVVNDQGLVNGFDNLYIFDASVMPKIPRGMLNLTVFAIAEKMSSMLIQSIG